VQCTDRRGIDGTEYFRGGKTTGGNMSGWKNNWREYVRGVKNDWRENVQEGICPYPYSYDLVPAFK